MSDAYDNAQGSTAKVLDEAVNAFIARQERKYGSKFSKRTISKNFLGEGLEASTLSRWTNPGQRRNSMIPTFRIPEVAKLLTTDAATHQRIALESELMTARIAELSQDPKNEALVIATWVARAMELSADEAALVTAYQRIAGDYPHRVFDNPEALAEFEVCLKEKMKGLWDEFFAERAIKDETPESPAVTALKAKTAAKVVKTPAENMLALSKAQRDAEYSARYQANTALRDIQAKLGITPLARIPKKRPK